MGEGEGNRPERPRVVVVGASAGGLDALRTLLSSISSDFPLPILVVQHLSPHHPSSLVPLLAKHSTLMVHQAMDGAVPLAGHVYVALPDYHLLVEDGRIVLSHSDRVRFSRPSVDRLFESVACSYEGGVIGVILSGEGSDGTAGAQAIRAAGGQVVVQDPETAANHGMPRSASAAGAASRVLAIDRIGPYLEEATRES